MNEDRNQFSEQPEAAPTGNRGCLARALLLWLPLLVMAACLIFSAARPALFGAGIPVTGGDPLAPPTASPGETLPPRPVGQPLAGVQVSYKVEAALRLRSCSSIFHEFFILEQVAIHQPDLASSASWQRDAVLTADAFQDGCRPIGMMPFVPSAYEDVDRWMKLAAAEVDPAAESFTALLNNGAGEHKDEVIDHLLRFIEYTGKAQDLMERLDKRKQM